MLSRTPIFLPASEGLAAGISLFESSKLGAARARAVWVQGALILPAAEADTSARRDRWLCALTLSVVTEKDQLAAAAKVVPQATLGSVWREVKIAARPHRAVEFAFDIRDAFGDVPKEPFYIHLSAERHISAIQRREGAPAPAAALMGKEGGGALDSLSIAYALCRAGNHARALNAFRTAFTQDDIPADLDRPHLFNAACAASLAIAKATDAPTREKLVAQSLKWLDEDFKLAHERLSEIWRELSRAPEEEARQRLVAQRQVLTDELDARATDPDLAAVRESSAWRPSGKPAPAAR